MNPRAAPAMRSKSPEELEAELAVEEDALARFHLVTGLLRGALAAGHAERLQRHAAHALELARCFPDNWDHGNGLHLGHTALGLLALDRGEVEAAAQHLLASAQTPGSPQLNTFGPDLQLARRLLGCGQHVAVRAFLTRCHDFWEMGRGKLHSWTADLDAGTTPRLHFLG